MITITVPFDNPLNQKTYENLINTLQFHQLQCTCGHSGCLTIHGYYTRSLKEDDSEITLSIVNDIKNFVFGPAKAPVYGFGRNRKQKFVMSFTIFVGLNALIGPCHAQSQHCGASGAVPLLYGFRCCKGAEGIRARYPS